MAYRVNSINKEATRGFTLIELMLVLGLLTILISITISSYNYFMEPENLASAKIGVVEAVRLARIRSQSGNGDSTWGVKLTSTEVVIFKGASYTMRDPEYDQSLDLLGTIPSGVNEIVFDKISGLTSTTGIITLTNNFGSINILINEKGTLTY